MANFTKLISRFKVGNDSGQTCTISEYQEFLSSITAQGTVYLPGARSLRTRDGQYVNCINQEAGEYQIAWSGINLKRLIP